MSDSCCSSHCMNSNPVKYSCPVNGIEYPEVPVRTIAHHIKQSWLWKGKDQPYYFCDDPNCDVVYFGVDDSVILTSQMRTTVGVKDKSDEAMVCYCYGVTKADALNEQGIREFVIAQTKHKECSCETSNPSGRCCLKYFPH
jgi:hypothetical protein